jgi:uncharacterized protein YcfJ
MELTQSPTPTASRIHPLVAGAAVAVTLVSLLGVAAVTGLLPNSHGGIESRQAAAATMPTVTAATTSSVAAPAPVLVQTPAGYQYMQPVSAPVAAYQQIEPQNTAPKTTHHTPRHHAQTYAQADTRQPTYQQPAYQQPARQANSPIGIATGAVVGGLLGNQVGKGNGRTLATVAGAVGGGYLGNMAGQKYGY